MESIKVMATIDGALYELEAKQTDPLHPNFELLQDGEQSGCLADCRRSGFDAGDSHRIRLVF